MVIDTWVQSRDQQIFSQNNSTSIQFENPFIFIAIFSSIFLFIHIKTFTKIRWKKLRSLFLFFIILFLHYNWYYLIFLVPNRANNRWKKKNWSKLWPLEHYYDIIFIEWVYIVYRRSVLCLPLRSLNIGMKVFATNKMQWIWMIARSFFCVRSLNADFSC